MENTMENKMKNTMENTIEAAAENKIEKQSNIPSSAFDIEYRTQWRDEVDFLTSRGIYYTFRKKEGEYGIPTYKYTKTLELFLALADFYMHRKPNVKSRATYQGPNARPLRGKTEQRSAKKPVPAAEEKAEQLSFVQKDGSLDPKYVQDKADKAEEAKPEEAKIEEVKTPKAAEKDPKIEEAMRILRESGYAIAKKKSEEDDTE